VRSDGALVRILRVTPVNPLLLDRAQARALATGFARLGQELEPGVSVQFYVESRGTDAPIGVHVVVPSHGRASHGRPAIRPAGAARGLALRASLLDAESMGARLTDLGTPARLLDGPDVAALCLRRLDQSALRHEGRPIEVLGELDAGAEEDAAARAAGDLRERLALLAPHFAARHAEIGRDLEQTVHLGSAPGAATFGWVAGLLEIAAPFVLSVHVHAPAAGAAPTISLYQSLRVPGPDASLARLAEAADAAAERLAALAEASVHRGEFRQRELWLSTLPVALDAAAATHECAAERLGSAVPLLATRCGSSGGVSLGANGSGGSERLDPFDPLHPTAALLVTGQSAAVTARAVLAQLGAFGMRVATVGRPPLAAARLGTDVHAGAWDVGDRRITPGHVAFLVAIHELLLADADELTPTARGCLRLRIHRVLAHAAREGRNPRSRDLLRELAEGHDRATGGPIAARLERVLADGAAAQLLDGPTNLAATTELVVDDWESATLTRAATLTAAEHLIGELSRAPGGSRGAALLIEGADRLSAVPAAACWLRKAAHAARRRGVLVIAASEDVHPSETLTSFSMRLALAPADAGPPSAHWVNGARGQGIVALLPQFAEHEPADAR